MVRTPQMVLRRVRQLVGQDGALHGRQFPALG